MPGVVDLQREYLSNIVDIRQQENNDRMGKQIQKNIASDSQSMQDQISDLQDQINAIKTFLGI